MIKPKKIDIKKRIDQLITLINKWNRLYYLENFSAVSDSVYDQHLEELKKWEKEYPDLKRVDSPTVMPGFAPSSHFQKFVHQKPMLSLNNAFKKTDVQAFAQRINKFTAGKHTYYCEPKIDGLSIALVFKNNLLSVAATRGNGEIGENVTANIQAIPFWQQFSQHHSNELLPFDFEIRGEVFITKKNFIKLNEKLRFQAITELKSKFEKNRTLLIKILTRYFLGFVFTNKKQNEATSSLVIEDNLQNLLRNNSLTTSRIRGEFSLSLDFTDNDWKAVLPKFLLDFKKQKRFVIFFQKITDHCGTLKLFFHINLENKLFTNSRNVASGSLRQLDPAVTKDRLLSFVFYELIQKELNHQQKQEQSIQWLQKKGFPVSTNNRLCLNLEEVFAYIEHIQKIKDTLDYEIDGVVIKVNEHHFYPQIGKTTKFPNYAIAFKYPSAPAQTIVLDIFPTVGRTGRITYNAKLKDVFLGNTIVKSATLHNANYVQDLDVRIGDHVFVKKAGDIIPKVVGVNMQKRKTSALKWIKNQHCPSCQKPLSILAGEVDQYCFNDACEEKQIQALIHFVSQSAMDVVGLSEQNIRLFWNRHLIRNFTDIFKLKEKEAQIWDWKKQDKLNKLGLKSLSKLFQAIEKAKQNSLEKLLFGLNIRHLGFKAARVVAQHFRDAQKLINVQSEDLLAIAGFGPILSTSIVNFFNQKENIKLIDDLQKLGVNLKFNHFQLTNDSFFLNKGVVITGVFSFASRTELTNQLQARGANVINAISPKVDFLIVGQSPGSKLAKAQNWKIKIIDESEIIQLLAKK